MVLSGSPDKAQSDFVDRLGRGLAKGRRPWGPGRKQGSGVRGDSRGFHGLLRGSWRPLGMPSIAALYDLLEGKRFFFCLRFRGLGLEALEKWGK